MTSEPTAESFAEQFGDKSEVALPPIGYREMESHETIQRGDVFYGADPPSDPPRIHKSLSIGFTPAHSIHRYRYFRPVEQPEPTYTMQQAIDRIVDGLVLEWVVSPIADYCRAVTVMGNYYTYADRWIDIFDNEFPCESMDHAKELCLRDYKSRFRAEIEKAVANHE